MNKTISINISIRSIIFWLAIVLAILFFIDSCKRNFLGGIFGGGKTDTLRIVRDTVWVAVQGDTVYIPTPYSVTNTIYKPLYKTDTLEITEVLPTDTAAIIARYYQKAFYSDTISKSDTALRKYGYIVVNDSVHQNRITSRRVITDLKIPEVTNTVTLVKNRFVVYAGVDAMGTITSPLYAVGGSLSIKAVNGKMYSVSALSTKNGQIYYLASYKAPIRLKRNK